MLQLSVGYNNLFLEFEKKYYEMQCFVHIVDVQLFATNETSKITRGVFRSAVNYKILHNCSYFCPMIFFVQKQYFSKRTVFFFYLQW